MGDFFGASAANIGDINKDGFDDIAISAVGFPSWDSGRVYVYYSGTQMDTINDTILYHVNSDFAFGRLIKNGGDINDDNIMDFFICTGESNIFLYLGVDSLIIIDGSLLGVGGFINIESININNDEYNDFIIGNTNYLNSESLMVGGAFIYLGNEKLDDVYKYKIEGETKWGEFSKIISHSDINRDNYDELFVLAPSFPDFDYPQGKVYIYSYKKITNVINNDEKYPKSFKLHQNYPNPFNSSTRIHYSLPQSEDITLVVYDLLGRLIATLINERKHAGEHEIEFNAENLSTGIYFCRLKAGNITLTKKIILLK